MKLLTNGALLCYDLSLVGHVSKAAIGSFYMVLPAFNIFLNFPKMALFRTVPSNTFFFLGGGGGFVLMSPHSL